MKQRGIILTVLFMGALSASLAWLYFIIVRHGQSEFSFLIGAVVLQGFFLALAFYELATVKAELTLRIVVLLLLLFFPFVGSIAYLVFIRPEFYRNTGG